MDIRGVEKYTFNLSLAQNNTSKARASNASNTFFCNPLGSNVQERVMQRRNQARQQATRLLQEQFKNHEKINESIENMEKEIDKNKEDLKIYNEQLKWFQDQKEALKKEYGITDDSAEQKDLLLIEKARESGILSLTDDEKKHFLELDGVTTYQAYCLDMDEGIKIYKAYIADANNTIDALNSATKDLRIARLKDNGMFAAQNAADAIMEGVNDEVIAMVVQDSLHIITETQEKAAENAENIQKQLDTTTNKEIQTDSSTDLVEKFNKIIKELQQKLKALQQTNDLSADDLKGLMVDQTV